MSSLPSVGDKYVSNGGGMTATIKRVAGDSVFFVDSNGNEHGYAISFFEQRYRKLPNSPAIGSRWMNKDGKVGTVTNILGSYVTILGNLELIDVLQHNWKPVPAVGSRWRGLESGNLYIISSISDKYIYFRVLDADAGEQYTSERTWANFYHMNIKEETDMLYYDRATGAEIKVLHKDVKNFVPPARMDDIVVFEHDGVVQYVTEQHFNSNFTTDKPPTVTEYLKSKGFKATEHPQIFVGPNTGYVYNSYWNTLQVQGDLYRGVTTIDKVKKILGW